MTELVIDASIALAWCFSDESNDPADQVLLALSDRTGVVPTIWSVEIANAMLVGERRRRIRQPEISRFIELLRRLTIVEDGQSYADNMGNIIPLAREYNLSAYDAAYLDVALRRGASLATLDVRLQKAGRAAGVKIFES